MPFIRYFYLYDDVSSEGGAIDFVTKITRKEGELLQKFDEIKDDPNKREEAFFYFNM